MANQVVYTLYFYPFSLYSLMVRFALALGDKLNPTAAPKVDLKLVNLQDQENFSEEYLTLNWKGQIPILTSSSLPTPLTDSRDIANWLCEQQPELLPSQHRETIDRLMDKLYLFHGKALSVPQDDRKDGIPNVAAALLEQPTISEHYRRCLEIKSVYHDTMFSNTFDQDNFETVEEQARDFITDLALQIQEHQHGGKYIFGDSPTIIDAHATAMLARLIDMERDDLFVDQTAKDYAVGVMATDEWQRLTHGRRTRWDESLGPVKDMKIL